MTSVTVPSRTIFDDASLKAEVETFLGALSPGKRGKFVTYYTLDGRLKMQAVQRIGESWVIGASFMADLRRGVKGGLSGGLFVGGEWS